MTTFASQTHISAANTPFYKPPLPSATYASAHPCPPSRLMPTLRHFSSRQCWHRLRVLTVTGQLFFSTARHRYWRLARTLRLKKLLQASQLTTPKWLPDDLSPHTTHGGNPTVTIPPDSSGSLSPRHSSTCSEGSFFMLTSPIMATLHIGILRRRLFPSTTSAILYLYHSTLATIDLCPPEKGAQMTGVRGELLRKQIKGYSYVG